MPENKARIYRQKQSPFKLDDYGEAQRLAEFMGYEIEAITGLDEAPPPTLSQRAKEIEESDGYSNPDLEPGDTIPS